MKPSIVFIEMEGLPTVSTCALTLLFPISFPTEFSQFKNKMNDAILGSQGFMATLNTQLVHASHDCVHLKL